MPWRSRPGRMTAMKRIGLARETTWQHVAEGRRRTWSHSSKPLAIKTLDFPAYSPLVFVDTTDFPHRAFTERLNELRNSAAELGWGVDAESESLFYEFIDAAPVMYMPMVTLRPGGTLRAIWEAAGDEQIGLHFAGSAELNYVLFSRDSQGEVGRHFGSSDRDHVLAIVHALGLDYLLRP